MNTKEFHIDIFLLGLTVLLVGIGIVIIYSASFAVAGEKFGSYNFFILRHLIRVGLGFAALYIAMNIDYHHWARMDRILLGVSIFLLGVLLFSGDVQSINGARRWIRIGGFSFQPSEIAKIVLVLFMARSLSRDPEKIGNFKEGLLPHLVVLAVVAGMIALEPNFSTTIAIITIGMSMIYIAGARFRHLVALCLPAIPLLYIFLLRAPYRRARVLAFLDRSNSVSSIGYQAHQALIGLGSGGFFGCGLGQSRQKLFYLPEPYTDFVFAILGEEFGFLGSFLIMMLFALFIWRGLTIALNAPDRYGYLLGFGITCTVCVYVLFHTGVVTSLLPTTGIPMPFISYGGMSLVFTMFAVGILLNISGQSRTSFSFKINPLRRK